VDVHAPGAHARAARPPVLRRARVQGAVRADARRARAPDADLEHARDDDGGRGRTQGRDVRRVAEDVLVLLAVYAARLVPKSRKVGKTTITVWAAADQIGQADFALDAAANALKNLNSYFGLPYQLPKLDLVAAPDFASGAMENWGAILFRDANLLIDPKLSSEAMKRRVAEVVTHEIVHQWFGNLVTMKWWNDLWLNEAFATWLAAKIVDQWKPEWRVWDDFDGGKRAPLAIDALPGTRPVRSAAATPAEIQAMFDPITYQKGGALLRMLERYVGERAFRAAVRAYIRRYQYGNAEAGDLGRELERASGKPVKKMMDGWLKQAGAPRVSVSADGPGRAHFESDPGAPHGRRRRRRDALGRAGRDPLPPQRRDEDAHGARRAERKVDDLRASRTRRTAVGVPNAGETGYYRLDLSPALLKAALARKDELTPVERAGLLNHLWAAVRAGTLPAARFLDALAAFKGDPSRLVIEDAAGYLKALSQRSAPTRRRARSCARPSPSSAARRTSSPPSCAASSSATTATRTRSPILRRTSSRPRWRGSAGIRKGRGRGRRAGAHRGPELAGPARAQVRARRRNRFASGRVPEGPRGDRRGARARRARRGRPPQRSGLFEEFARAWPRRRRRSRKT